MKLEFAQRENEFPWMNSMVSFLFPKICSLKPHLPSLLWRQFHPWKLVRPNAGTNHAKTDHCANFDRNDPSRKRTEIKVGKIIRLDEVIFALIEWWLPIKIFLSIYPPLSHFYVSRLWMIFIGVVGCGFVAPPFRWHFAQIRWPQMWECFIEFPWKEWLFSIIKWPSPIIPIILSSISIHVHPCSRRSLAISGPWSWHFPWTMLLIFIIILWCSGGHPFCRWFIWWRNWWRRRRWIFLHQWRFPAGT